MGQSRRAPVNVVASRIQRAVVLLCLMGLLAAQLPGAQAQVPLPPAKGVPPLTPSLNATKIAGGDLSELLQALDKLMVPAGGPSTGSVPATALDPEDLPGSLSGLHTGSPEDMNAKGAQDPGDLSEHKLLTPAGLAMLSGGQPGSGGGSAGAAVASDVIEDVEPVAIEPLPLVVPEPGPPTPAPPSAPEPPAVAPSDEPAVVVPAPAPAPEEPEAPAAAQPAPPMLRPAAPATAPQAASAPPAAVDGGISATVAALAVAAFARFLFGLGLLSRIRRKDLLRHKQRARIHDFVHASPGVHFSEIQRHLGMARGQAAYHLHVLEAAGLLVKMRANGYDCYFANGASRALRGAARALRPDKARAILGMATRGGAVPLQDLVASGSMSRSMVYYHLKRLSSAGLVQVGKEGRRSVVTATPLAAEFGYLPRAEGAGDAGPQASGS